MKNEVKLIVDGKSIATCRFDEISIFLSELADDDTVNSVTVEFVK
jgi:hypothetical protein